MVSVVSVVSVVYVCYLSVAVSFIRSDFSVLTNSMPYVQCG